MTFAEIRTEVLARGFDFDTTTRVNTWINRAYQRICDRQAWPFLETSTSGTAPLSISDVRAVLTVLDTTADCVVTWEDPRSIRERDPDFSTTTGTPESWYLDGSSLKVYPTNTSNTLSVHYLKVPTTLSADGDTPLLPTRYHYAIVDGAVLEAYKDTDNFEAMAVMREEVEIAISEMTNALLVQNYDSPAELLVTGSTDW